MALQTKQDHRLPAQLAARLAQRIENHALRPGTRLPSIRNCAEESRVSRSTVVEAYDQLIAAGLIESRRGSGFYVRLRANKPAHRRAPRAAAAGHRARRELAAARAAAAVAGQRAARRGPAARKLARSRNGRRRRARRGAQPRLVAAQVRRDRGLSTAARGAEHAARAGSASTCAPEQIVTTAGATEAIDLVARRFLAPGDLVFVEDPAWFVMFARFAAFGARIVGVPRGADGPDIAALESLLARERPKLFILNSVAHNPTGSCMSADSGGARARARRAPRFHDPRGRHLRRPAGPARGAAREPR